MVNLNVTNDERDIIIKISKRAAKLFKIDLIDTQMDLCAVHVNDCKLKLADFLEADDFNFAHDIYGIRSNLDRKTGKLKNCFLPRFAR